MLCTIALPGCSDDEPVLPAGPSDVVLSGIGSALTLDAGPAPIAFTLRADSDWAIVKTSLDWLEITPMQGVAGKEQTVTVTAAANPAATERHGSFRITVRGAEKTIAVTQRSVVIPQYDTHPAGHLFFADNFDWIASAWSPKHAASRYGWPTLKIDGAQWNEFNIASDADILNLFDEIGYEYDETNTYLRYEGYIKLGRAAQVGALRTPPLEGIDPGCVATVGVRFRTGMYFSIAGSPDKSNYVSVHISGSGTITSCGTTETVVTDDGKSARIPIATDDGHRWRWTAKEFVVAGADRSTCIQFGGSESMQGRCFIDEIAIVRAAEGAVAAADFLPSLPDRECEITDIPDEPLPAKGGRVTRSIRVNRAWSLRSDQPWLRIVRIASGDDTASASVADDGLSASVTATCLPYNNSVFAADANPAPAPRTATVTVTAEDTILSTLTFTQEAGSGDPSPAGPVELARWNFSGITSGSAKGKAWIAGEPVRSEEDDLCTMQFLIGAQNRGEVTYSTGTTTMNKNRFRAHDIFVDDCFLFTVPVSGIAAGSLISFENAYVSATQYGPKYWMLEYSLDGGGSWAPAAECVTEASETNHARQATYTHKLSKQDDAQALDCTFPVHEAIASGTILLRVRICDPAQSKAANGDMETPNAKKGIAYLLSDQALFNSDTKNSELEDERVFVRFTCTPPTNE